MSCISIIAAIGKNGELGLDGKLLWHLPDDLKRFKKITLGHPVIMGRKTWESIPDKFRPLPERTNIVITRQHDYIARGALCVGSIEDARAAAARASGFEEIFIIGGGELYYAALPFADRLYLTLINAEAEADTFFPPYAEHFRKTSEEVGAGDPPHRFLTFERI